MGNPKGVKRNFKELETRRLKAVVLMRQGETNAAIGRQLKVSRHSVGRWREELKKGGVRQLHAAGRAGRKPKLTSSQAAEVVKALEKGAQAQGYSSELWTLPRVAKLIMDVTGVEYHPCYVGEILKRLGWSCQRPMLRAKERDEEAIQGWRKKEWPRLKKKPKKSVES